MKIKEVHRTANFKDKIDSYRMVTPYYHEQGTALFRYSIESCRLFSWINLFESKEKKPCKRFIAHTYRQVPKLQLTLNCTKLVVLKDLNRTAAFFARYLEIPAKETRLRGSFDSNLYAYCLFTYCPDVDVVTCGEFWKI